MNFKNISIYLNSNKIILIEYVYNRQVVKSCLPVVDRRYIFIHFGLLKLWSHETKETSIVRYI